MVESFWRSLGFGKLKKISFGLVGGIFLLWLMFNASGFVPEGMELKYTLAFLGYGLLGSYMFSREDIKAKLNRISFIRASPIFLGVTFVFFILFSFLFGLVVTPDSVLTSLVGIPVYLMLINAFVFAFVETSFFQGLLDEKIGILGSVMVAGLFHMFIWTGGLFANFVGSALVFLLFSTTNFYARRYFSKKYSSRVAVVLALIVTIAVHTAYNMAKYRIIYGV